MCLQYPDRMRDTPGTRPPGFDPSQDILLDPRRLRGLAHPLRLRLRGELVEHGPATATQLAHRVGVSSGVTSYHLRQLAAHGFVVEDPDQGQGRERYWRAPHRATYLDGSLIATEHEASAAYLRAVARMHAERVIRFADTVDAPQGPGSGWSDGFDLSDYILTLAPEQATDLARRLHEVCRSFREVPAAGPQARHVVVQFQVMALPPPADAP